MAPTESTARLPGEDDNMYKARLIVDHVSKSFGTHLTRWRSTTDATRLYPPLIIGLQGPQGSGKTTITSQLKEQLEAREFSSKRKLRVVILSIDDLYLTHRELDELKAAHPLNRLLHGRGQPGTHDVALGTRVLEGLRNINSSFTADGKPQAPIELPVFDKSLFDGEGDRSARTVKVEPDVDIVLFEGWCLGFAPIGREQIETQYQQAQERHRDGAGGPAPYFLQHSLESLVEIDERLREYERQWYPPSKNEPRPLISAFVQLRPCAGGSAPVDDRAGLESVFQWRLQAEHQMKAANGGKGMTDAQVRAFVERYMPGYELWGGQVSAPSRPWHGRGLRIDIGPQREVLGVAHF